ncbi:diacylglycerol kinase [Kitasatospora sp. NPDC092948]|uniref:diacylglycerol kinase n=1 Tax=Kitasatospora sp. NPDC092948 TaxID=3364088 RepID=UPI00380A9142
MSSLSTPVSRPPDAEGAGPLLVVLDPSARQADGESVRIAKDVLRGGADVKVTLPESPSELDRVLAHRGRRRAVVIGSDQALQRVLQALHRHRELDADPVGLVPVGGPVATATARLLGVPAEPVAAARTVLAGSARRLGLLLDDGGGVVLSEVRFTGPRQGRTGGWRSLWAKLAAAEQASPSGSEELRIEVDGRLLADVHQRVRHLRVAMVGDAMELALDLDGSPHRLRAGRLTVAGRGFGYEADGCPVGPVRNRTWTVRPDSWRLLLPAG